MRLIGLNGGHIRGELAVWQRTPGVNRPRCGHDGGVSVANASLSSMKSDRLPHSSRLAGITTTAELVEAGFAKTTIRALVRQGVLTPVRRGAYARTDLISRTPGLDRRRERILWIAAAVAVVGADAVGSHHDAAVVHGLDLLERPPVDLIAVSRQLGPDGIRTGRPVVRVRAASLPRSQVTVRHGVQVTSVARTVVDLARSTPFRSGVVVADSALHSKKTSKAELSEVIVACARWPGIDRARQVVAFSDARSESPFESISRVAFRDGGLPPPELQVWVGDDSGAIGRVDFLWRAHRTVAEADGAIKYADPDRARRQLRRDAELREAGFEVVHFSWRELTVTSDQVVQSIRAAFRRSAAVRAAERTARQALAGAIPPIPRAEGG